MKAQKLRNYLSMYAPDDFDLQQVDPAKLGLPRFAEGFVIDQASKTFIVIAIPQGLLPIKRLPR